MKEGGKKKGMGEERKEEERKGMEEGRGEERVTRRRRERGIIFCRYFWVWLSPEYNIQILTDLLKNRFSYLFHYS